jgi:hypothetical protein
VTNFTTKYYADTLPSVHNPTPRYNADENESKLNLFRGQLGRESVVTHKNLQHEEWRTIMMYVEIQQSSVYAGDDVYIVAQQATQVYYLSYPCKTDERL